MTSVPKVAIFPAQDQPSQVSATLIQSALTNARVIDRRMLGRHQIESILNGKPPANVGIDYLLVVYTSAMPSRGGWLARIGFGSGTPYEISTVIEVINPATTEIVKTIIVRTLASQADFRARLGLAIQPLSFSLGKSKTKEDTHGVAYVIGELNKVFTSGEKAQY